MKKLFIFAFVAVMAANAGAQEAKAECKEKKMSSEERVEMDIKRFRHELYLSDQQAANFAVTYRDYSAAKEELFRKGKECCRRDSASAPSDDELDKFFKQRLAGQKKLIELKEKYYGKFRKDLNPRQTATVLRLNENHHHPKGGNVRAKGEVPRKPQERPQGKPLR